MMRGAAILCWWLCGAVRAFTQNDSAPEARLAGSAWSRHTIDNTSRGADGIKLGDVNGDAQIDLITGWEEGGEVRLYLNPGPKRARTPWPKVTVGKVAAPEDAILLDVDGDGHLDAISATEGKEKTLFIHRTTSNRVDWLDPSGWSTQPVPATRGRQMWMHLLPLQIDGQNGIDIVTGSKLQNGAIGWLRAPRDARELAAWTWHPLRPAGWIMSLIALDMDGDGDQDILFSDRKGPAAGIGWLENPGADAPWGEHPLGAAGREVMFLDVADLSQDRRLEIVAAVKPSRILLLHSSQSGKETWREEWVEVGAPCGTAKAVKAADLDRDGRMDLVYSCEEAKGKLRGVIWMRRTGDGWEANDLSGPEGTKFDLIQTFDVDGDGDLDVLSCEETDNLGVFWYENPTKER